MRASHSRATCKRCTRPSISSSAASIVASASIASRARSDPAATTSTCRCNPATVALTSATPGRMRATDCSIARRLSCSASTCRLWLRSSVTFSFTSALICSARASSCCTSGSSERLAIKSLIGSSRLSADDEMPAMRCSRREQAPLISSSCSRTAAAALYSALIRCTSADTAPVRCSNASTVCVWPAIRSVNCCASRVRASRWSSTSRILLSNSLPVLRLACNSIARSWTAEVFCSMVSASRLAIRSA